MVELRDMSKGIAQLAAYVTSSESLWTTFQKDPAGFAARNGYAVTLDQTAINKIRDTTYADAKAKLGVVDLNSTAGLW
jgi:hypothetical protein